MMSNSCLACNIIPFMAKFSDALVTVLIGYLCFNHFIYTHKGINCQLHISLGIILFNQIDELQPEE